MYICIYIVCFILCIYIYIYICICIHKPTHMEARGALLRHLPHRAEHGVAGAPNNNTKTNHTNGHNTNHNNHITISNNTHFYSSGTLGGGPLSDALPARRPETSPNPRREISMYVYTYVYIHIYIYIYINMCSPSIIYCTPREVRIGSGRTPRVSRFSLHELGALPLFKVVLFISSKILWVKSPEGLPVC